MGIELTTSISEVNAKIEKAARELEADIVRNLSYVGERCIIEARSRSEAESWIDRTGNLRSSIGYVVIVGGNIVKMSPFAPTKPTATIGKLEGQSLATDLAKTFKSGFALIVVAGMEYAAYVESCDNKNVLVSAYELAQTLVPKMVKKLSNKKY